MQYVSTRGDAPVLGFSDAVLAGLARDGGLYLPREWPQFSSANIRAMRGLAYPDLAIRVLTPFLGGEIAAP
ncbi:MAG: threonine synthase, partial [Mesorhizobium sp.]